MELPEYRYGKLKTRKRKMRQFVRYDGWFSIPRKLFALAKHVKNKIKSLTTRTVKDDFSSSALVIASSV